MTLFLQSSDTAELEVELKQQSGKKAQPFQCAPVIARAIALRLW